MNIESGDLSPDFYYINYNNIVYLRSGIKGVALRQYWEGLVTVPG